MAEIPDQVFAQGVLGQCCGIKPDEGKVYAPFDGTVTQVADTKHAIGLQGPKGVELLIHVGLDTVDMNGQGFDVQVKEEQEVRKGQLLLTMDLKQIAEAGHPDVVMMAVTNSDGYEDLRWTVGGRVAAGEDVAEVG
ncbi:MAG: PTS glucose transporter subunit IIA [Lachnospiraceae bacterium]|nr:PTS glucose transporter subunit IIA [Lachnospiraceae bacterium]